MRMLNLVKFNSILIKIRIIGQAKSYIYLQLFIKVKFNVTNTPI